MAGVIGRVKIQVVFRYFKLFWCLFLIQNAKLRVFPIPANTLKMVFSASFLYLPFFLSQIGNPPFANNLSLYSCQQPIVKHRYMNGPISFFTSALITDVPHNAAPSTQFAKAVPPSPSTVPPPRPRPHPPTVPRS